MKRRLQKRLAAPVRHNAIRVEMANGRPRSLPLFRLSTDAGETWSEYLEPETFEKRTGLTLTFPPDSP